MPELQVFTAGDANQRNYDRKLGVTVTQSASAVSQKAAPVEVDGALARVRFNRYGLEAYERFLRCKALPESRIAYDWRTDIYELTTPSRFAPLIDASIPARAVTDMPLAPHLFDYQQFIVERALEARRYAPWVDTGLGKTAMFLEWGRHVIHRTGGRVLILSPLQVIEQTREESERFYGPAVNPLRLENRQELIDWCREGAWPLAVSNYDKLIPGQVPELRHLAGLVLDESSILKSGGGVIKWNLIKSARGIEYKLSCTATPAPNDTMEYASQASFLEKLRTEGEILWTFFTRDKAGNWRVKPHARAAFYAFMASWSIYLRDPAHYGFADILSTLPPPVYHEHRIALTSEQRDAMHRILVRTGSGMFTDRLGVRERSKLSQLAKGFLYESENGSRAAHPVPSLKPALVADLVRQEVAAGRQTLVWTVFDEEARIVARELGDAVSAEVLDGATSEADRQLLITEFKDGAFDVLISKAALLGHGMNFQNVKSMVFSGFDDSFERLYQAVRRAYRFGQTDTVRVHIPYVPELEGMIFENVMEKQGRFMSDAEDQERRYREVMGL